MSCYDYVDIHLEAANWLPGEYVVSVVTSNRRYECRFTKAAAGAGGQAGSPNLDLALQSGRCEQVSGRNYSDPSLTVEERVTIELHEAAKHVTIDVGHDHAVILHAELTPSYTTYIDDGCRQCVNASETLTLPGDG